jgi:metal-responsive CopG/Arc/MetJ family transcriptional regulator
MKTAISLPDSLFAEAERVAKRLRISRSKFYAKAIAEYVNAQRARNITEQLNEIYGKEDSKLEPTLHKLQLKSLPHEDW